MKCIFLIVFLLIPYGVLSIMHVLSHHELTMPMISKALSSRLHVPKCISPYRRVHTAHFSQGQTMAVGTGV